MNLTAAAVLPLVKQKRIKLTDLLVVCDDVNLPLGKVRIRPRGSAGGHKGLRSIIQAFDSEDFPRLRIGIGAPTRIPLRVNLCASVYFPATAPARRVFWIAAPGSPKLDAPEAFVEKRRLQFTILLGDFTSYI